MGRQSTNPPTPIGVEWCGSIELPNYKIQLSFESTFHQSAVPEKPMTSKILLPILFTGIFFTGLSCNSPTEPKDNPDPDTTSHNFVWDIDTIGYSSVTLSDGVIINESDMWVVGDIYPDSASYWNTIRFGAAHWDGIKWIPIKIPVQTITPNPYTFNLSPQGIIKVKENEFWLVAGSVHVFDGQKVTKSYWIHNVFGIPNPIFNEGQTPQHIYQTSDKKVYIYGINGALAYFDGSSWVKIETNTNLDIMDMQGDYNPQTKEYELMALASRIGQKEGNLLFKIKNERITTISVSGMNDFGKSSLWFKSGMNYYVAGDGIYYKKQINDPTWQRISNYPASNWAANTVRGNKESDLFITLNDGHLLHYNGSTWKDFRSQLNLANVSVNQIILNSSNVLILGYLRNGSRKGIIIRGKHI